MGLLGSSLGFAASSFPALQDPPSPLSSILSAGPRPQHNLCRGTLATSFPIPGDASPRSSRRLARYLRDLHLRAEALLR